MIIRQGDLSEEALGDKPVWDQSPTDPSDAF